MNINPPRDNSGSAGSDPETAELEMLASVAHHTMESVTVRVPCSLLLRLTRWSGADEFQQPTSSWRKELNHAICRFAGGDIFGTGGQHIAPLRVTVNARRELLLVEPTLAVDLACAGRDHVRVLLCPGPFIRDLELAAIEARRHFNCTWVRACAAVEAYHRWTQSPSDPDEYRAVAQPTPSESARWLADLFATTVEELESASNCHRYTSTAAVVGEYRGISWEQAHEHIHGM